MFAGLSSIAVDVKILLDYTQTKCSNPDEEYLLFSCCDVDYIDASFGQKQ
jgi:hypothetical protein